MKGYRRTVTRRDLERSLSRTMCGRLGLLLLLVLKLVILGRLIADCAYVDEVFGPGDTLRRKLGERRRGSERLCVFLLSGLFAERTKHGCCLCRCGGSGGGGSGGSVVEVDCGDSCVDGNKEEKNRRVGYEPGVSEEVTKEWTGSGREKDKGVDENGKRIVYW